MTVNQTVARPIDQASEVPGTAWKAVLLLAVVLFAGALMRAVFSPLQEAAKIDLKLSDFSVSLVQGLATGAPVALAYVPLAWIIDHGRRVRLLTGLLAVCVVGTLWTAFAGSLATLFVARMLSALGATCAVSVVISLVSDLCAPDRRGRAIVVLGVATYAGIAAGFGLGGGLLSALAHHQTGLLGMMVPWRSTHLVISLVGTLLLFPLFFLDEPKRHEVEIADATLASIYRAILAKRRFLAPLFVGQIGVSMADTAATIWATPVLIRNFHQQPAQFAGWVGGLLLLGGIIGSIVGGLGADWGQKTGKRGYLLLAAVVATAVSVPAALFPVMPSVGGFALLFFFLLLSGTIASVVVSTTVTVLVPNEERGACMAAFGIINALIGLGLAPTIVTLGSWAMGGEQHLAASLAATGVVTGLLSFAGYVLAMRNAPLSATHPGWNPP